MYEEAENIRKDKEQYTSVVAYGFIKGAISLK
jgi:hypothetical protein